MYILKKKEMDLKNRRTLRQQKLIRKCYLYFKEDTSI